MSSSLDYEMETYADGTELDATPHFGAEDEDEEEEDDDDMKDEDDEEEEEADDELAKPAADDNDVRRHLRGTRQLYRRCGYYRRWDYRLRRWVKRRRCVYVQYGGSHRPHRCRYVRRWSHRLRRYVKRRRCW